MKVVIDCSMLFKNYFTEGYSRYITDALASLKKQRPEAEFYFLADKLPPLKMVPGLVEKDFIIKKTLPGFAGLKWWYNWILPSILRKTKADAVIMTGGIALPGMAIPQLVWIVESKKKSSKKKYFDWIKRKFPKTLQRAVVLLTDSDENKKKWKREYDFTHHKIVVVPPAFENGDCPIAFAEKQNIKDNYSLGRDFFLVAQTDFSGSGFIALLKAFARFKKQQQSNMQLLIVGLETQKDKRLAAKLDAFKYRADIHTYGELGEMEVKKLVGTAYALLQPRLNSSSLLRAYAMHVPVIINDSDFAVELAGDASLFVDFAHYEQTASQLALLFKDEVLRNEIIQKAGNRVKQFSTEKQAIQIWNSIVYAVEKNVK